MRVLRGGNPMRADAQWPDPVAGFSSSAAAILSMSSSVSASMRFQSVRPLLVLSLLDVIAESMRHQHRQLGVSQDMARLAPKNHLAQAALGVGALDQEVAAERAGALQDDLAGGAALGLRHDGLGRDAVDAQRARQILGRRAGYAAALD